MRVSEVTLQNLLNRPDVIAKARESGLDLHNSKQAQHLVDYLRSRIDLAKDVEVSISKEAWDLFIQSQK